jgi:hypothetical protein
MIRKNGLELLRGLEAAPCPSLVLQMGYLTQSHTKNRDRLLEADVAKEFLSRVVEQARAKGLTSDEHFTADGTLLEACASLNCILESLSVLTQDLGHRSPMVASGWPQLSTVVQSE